MGKEIAWEIRVNAEGLYVVRGLTYEQVAKAIGVSVSQLKNWGKAGNWRQKREEYRSAQGEIKRNTVLLRKNMIAKALNSLDPQDVSAVSQLEAVTFSRGREGREIRRDPVLDNFVTALGVFLRQKLQLVLEKIDKERR